MVQIEPGPIPTLIASTPASISALAASAVATLPGDDLRRIGELLHPFDRARNIAVVAVRGIDHDHVAFDIEQRLGAFEALVSHRGRGGDAKPARFVLGGIGEGHRLLDVLDGDQANAVKGIVHHQQLLDPALMQQAARIIAAGAEPDRGQVLVRHQFAHRLARIVGKANVAVGEDADQLAAGLDHRNAADPVVLHQRLRLAQRGIGRNGDRVDDHPALEALDRTHRGALLLDRKVAVKHADAAHLRHDNRHVRLGHGVHRR